MLIGQDNALVVDTTAHTAATPLAQPTLHAKAKNNLMLTSEALGTASASGNSSNLPANELSHEDLGALNYFNMWPHIFEAENGLNIDLDVDWAMGFSSYLAPNMSSDPALAGDTTVS